VSLAIRYGGREKKVWVDDSKVKRSLGGGGGYISKRRIVEGERGIRKETFPVPGRKLRFEWHGWRVKRGAESKEKCDANK